MMIQLPIPVQKIWIRGSGYSDYSDYSGSDASGSEASEKRIKRVLKRKQEILLKLLALEKKEYH